MKTEIEIHAYLNCSMCCDEVPVGESPETYGRLAVAMTDKGILIRCVRHSEEVELVTPERLEELMSYDWAENLECAGCGKPLSEHEDEDESVYH